MYWISWWKYPEPAAAQCKNWQILVFFIVFLLIPCDTRRVPFRDPVGINGKRNARNNARHFRKQNWGVSFLEMPPRFFLLHSLVKGASRIHTPWHFIYRRLLCFFLKCHNPNIGFPHIRQKHGWFSLECLANLKKPAIFLKHVTPIQRQGVSSFKKACWLFFLLFSSDTRRVMMRIVYIIFFSYRWQFLHHVKPTRASPLSM